VIEKYSDREKYRPESGVPNRGIRCAEIFLIRNRI
jgi:hypothetical protein